MHLTEDQWVYYMAVNLWYKHFLPACVKFMNVSVGFLKFFHYFIEFLLSLFVKTHKTNFPRYIFKKTVWNESLFIQCGLLNFFGIGMFLFQRDHTVANWSEFWE